MAEMITGARTFIDAPPVTPLGGGVLAAARVISTTGHALMGAQFLSDACGGPLEEWDEWCENNPVARKLFDGSYELVEGDPFLVYAGVDCALDGVAEAKTRATNKLTLNEGRNVDTHVLELAEAEANDLGGPFPLNEAIGVAEAYAATVYGGKPTLLIPRLVVPCACGSNLLHTNLDGTLTTCSGSLVAPVTTPVLGPVTSAVSTIYVTGQITLLQGAISAFSVPSQLHGDGTFAPARALAERIYVPLLDCFVAKVEASCS
jgi:hypothetical protein